MVTCPPKRPTWWLYKSTMRGAQRSMHVASWSMTLYECECVSVRVYVHVGGFSVVAGGGSRASC